MRLLRRGLAWLCVFGIVCLVLYIFAGLRHRLLRTPPAATQAQIEQARRIRILRDEWGVAHVFGRSDADTAFGIAYAHAQDDYPTIEQSLLAARGKLSIKELSIKN